MRQQPRMHPVIGHLYIEGRSAAMISPEYLDGSVVRMSRTAEIEAPGEHTSQQCLQRSAEALLRELAILVELVVPYREIDERSSHVVMDRREQELGHLIV